MSSRPAAHTEPRRVAPWTSDPPPADGHHDPAHVERRDVEPEDVAEKLRGMLGLHPGEPAPGEYAASHGRELPPLVTGLDAGAWIAWCLVGLTIFGEHLPPLRVVRRESYRVVVVLAMLRTRGNISAAARALTMTRKVLRENLVRGALLPWRLPKSGETAMARPLSRQAR